MADAPRNDAQGPVVSSDRIRAALRTVAVLVSTNPAYEPVFERLERELDIAVDRERTCGGVADRARRLLDQSATGLRSSAA